MGCSRCNCECHEPDSSVMHFMPCCDGVCYYCGFAFHGLQEHVQTKHKEKYEYDQDLKKRGRKPRWKDTGRTHDTGSTVGSAAGNDPAPTR